MRTLRVTLTGAVTLMLIGGLSAATAAQTDDGKAAQQARWDAEEMEGR